MSYDPLQYWQDVKARYGKSRVTIWRWINAGYFPKPIKIGPNGDTNAWRLSTLDKFDKEIDAKVA